MRTVVELSKKDIIRTIANAFDVDEKFVELDIEEMWVGYGPMEHKEQTVSARVTLKGE